MPSLQNYFWKLRFYKLVQRFGPIRTLGMDAKFNEDPEPKAKRPCLEDEKQGCDRQDNGATSVVDSILFPAAKKEVSDRY
jgi:hypothetical protein